MRLLLDVSGVAHASARKYNLEDTKGRGTSAIFGVLRALEALAAFDPSEIVVCFDGGSRARRELYPEYKAGRDNTDPVRIDIHRQLDVLREILEFTPV